MGPWCFNLLYLYLTFCVRAFREANLIQIISTNDLSHDLSVLCQLGVVGRPSKASNVLEVTQSLPCAGWIKVNTNGAPMIFQLQVVVVVSSDQVEDLFNVVLPILCILFMLFKYSSRHSFKLLILLVNFNGSYLVRIGFHFYRSSFGSLLILGLLGILRRVGLNGNLIFLIFIFKFLTSLFRGIRMVCLNMHWFWLKRIGGFIYQYSILLFIMLMFKGFWQFC